MKLQLLISVAVLVIARFSPALGQNNQHSEQNINPNHYLKVGDSLLEQSSYSAALNAYSSGIVLASEADSAHLLAELYTSAGIVYDYIGLFSKSIYCYQQAYTIMDSLNDQEWKAAILNNIGALFFQWQKFEAALDYYKRSLDIEKAIKNDKGVGESYENIGLVYKNYGKSDSAMFYYRKSLEISTMLKDSVMISTTFDNIGSLYLGKGSNAEAMDWFEKALGIQQSIDDEYGQLVSLNNLGFANMNLGNSAKAITLFEEAMKIGEEAQMASQLLYSYEKASTAAWNLGLYKVAYEYLNKSIAIRTNLYDEMSANQMAEMEARYELDKKDREILIGNLKIEQQEASIRRERMIKYFVIVGLLLSLGFGALLAFLYRQKRSAYQVLLMQNIELARQDQLLHEHKLPAVPMYERQPEELISPDEKYQKSSLTQEQKDRINEKLLQAMDVDRVYLNVDLSVEDLAEITGTNRRYLSQVINELHNTNFNSFINTYRVKEARRLLLDPANFHFSLEGIAASAGFNSRISFNNAFKKITGLTPAYFQKSYKDTKSA